MSHASMRIKFSTLFDHLPILPCIYRTNDDLIEDKPIEEPSKPIEEHAHRHHHGDETVRICQSLSCGLHLSCYSILVFFFWNVVRLKYFLPWKSFHGNENQSKNSMMLYENFVDIENYGMRFGTLKIDLLDSY